MLWVLIGSTSGQIQKLYFYQRLRDTFHRKRPKQKVDTSIKRSVRRRDKFYFHARESKDLDIKGYFKQFQCTGAENSERCLRHSFNIFTQTGEYPEPNIPDRNKILIKTEASYEVRLKNAFEITSIKKKETEM